jgi:hypothetical protein
MDAVVRVVPSEPAPAVARYRRAERAAVMSDSTLDHSLCPLCGAPNECGMARSASDCWCFGAKIRGGALELLPEAARGTVCVCGSCATKRSKPARTLKVER